MNPLNEYLSTLREDVRFAADAAGITLEEAFFERVSDTVTGSGEIEVLEYFHYRGAPNSGIRVDGWGGDPLTSGVLTLVVVELVGDIDTANVARTELATMLKRPMRFLRSTLDARWRDALEETSAGFALADAISGRWERVAKVRIMLLTNRRLSMRIDGQKGTEIEGRSVSYSVWDASRLQRVEGSTMAREDIVIDLAKHGGAVPVLEAHLPDSPYESYLAALPGATLASIYDRWGARLLEQNVRVFLQARGGVNKGIRNTIEEDPGMFFAYNNGITATAEVVEIGELDGVPAMTRLLNLQIVNGGQTTASIHAANRNGTDLSRTYVQMKLSIVDQKHAERIVPEISRFANSQNRIAAADFFSNHPFHVRMEEISRRLYAPAQEGSFTQGRWFYERARGQFADSLSRLTPAKQKQFKLEHPRSQLLTKTDLAKVEMTWRMRPNIVSTGAQKNFAQFAALVGREWEEDSKTFSEGWFRNAIAKVILFRRTERIVSDAVRSWYTGGLRAQTVCYAIAKLVHDTAAEGRTIDLRRIWDLQELPDSLLVVLDGYAEAMHEHLLSPPRGGSNPSEWAKKPVCRDAAMAIESDLKSDLDFLSVKSNPSL